MTKPPKPENPIELFEGEDHKPSRPTTIQFSTLSVMKMFLLIAGLLFMYAIKDILGIIFISIVLASALDPWVDKLQKRHINRAVSILSIYLIALGLFSAIIFLLIPPIVTEVKSIATHFPAYYENVINSLKNVEGFNQQGVQVEENVKRGLETLTQGLNNITSGLFTALTSVFGGIIALFGVLVMTFYMTVEEEGTKKFLRSVAPVKYQPYLVQKMNKIQEKMGAWFRGQLILSGIIGLISFVGLSILQVDYALVLALTAGVTEFVPYIGPIIGAVPAVFFAFNDSPMKALLVLIVYLIIQQLENQILVPKIMQRSVGLNPIIVIIVMLIGAKVAGVLGLLLAVPVATIVWVFLEDFFTEKRLRDSKLET